MTDARIARRRATRAEMPLPGPGTPLPGPSAAYGVRTSYEQPHPLVPVRPSGAGANTPPTLGSGANTPPTLGGNPTSQVQEDVR